MSTRALVAATAAALLLAGCSSAQVAETVDDAAAVAWTPCDGVTAEHVGRYTGEEMTEQTGTTDQPRCAFTPVTDGGPAFDLNYLWFDGGLDEAWEAMGRVDGTVTRIRVPGADAARIVVHARNPAVFVSGFVQTGGLVQSVNALQLRPYDEQAVVDATTELLGRLAREAPTTESG